MNFCPPGCWKLGYVGTHGIHQATQTAATAQGQDTTIPVQPCTNRRNRRSLPELRSLHQRNHEFDCQRCGPRAQLGFSANHVAVRHADLLQVQRFAQVTVRKQMAHGLQLQAAYTWSRAFITEPYGINAYPYFI